MPERDRGYFRMRHAQESERAESAEKPEVVLVHREFASRYAALLSASGEDMLTEPLAQIATASS
jgi:hypothetical protein